MRLDKFLCDMGAGTRSEVKRLIAKGQVAVNGEVVKDAAKKVKEAADTVTLSGTEIGYQRFEYYMLNKPAGVISASRTDLRNKDERCVVDLITSKKRKDLFPVGRLDKDTEGLLLITNDGALSHELLSPKKHVWKTYYAELSRGIGAADMERLCAGVDIGDEKPTLPCEVTPAEAAALSVRKESGADSKTEIRADGQTYTRIFIKIREGRYHQIKRMIETCGSEVTYLRRISMGSLALDESLAPGEYRALTEGELSALWAHSAM